ncbi:hypothetical protein DTW90_31355 [Neorhizobium sp. P12A]|nr:hypothetical protein DTW90_31355 [Neorhizobium sp. P12A]
MVRAWEEFQENLSLLGRRAQEASQTIEVAGPGFQTYRSLMEGTFLDHLGRRVCRILEQQSSDDSGTFPHGVVGVEKMLRCESP